jgi:ribonuclease D
MSIIQPVDKDKIKDLPPISFNGEILVVCSDEDENEAVEYLKRQAEIGFDTETKPSFKKGKPNNNEVALLQLATDDRAFLFRLNERPLSRQLINVLSSDDIIKAGAAVHDDIKALQHLHGFTAGGFVDIQDMAEEAGLEIKSLRKLTAMLFHMRLSKSQRLSNWEANRLTAPQINYAATDAWISLKIYHALNRVL